MELCCREGPDGGTGPRGKNPRKWLAVPASSGFPLNGCMPRVAWQQLGTSSRRTRNTSTSLRHGGCGANNGRRRVVVVVVRLLLLLLQPTPPPAWKQQDPAMADRAAAAPGRGALANPEAGVNGLALAVVGVVSKWRGEGEGRW